jgi:hypothetical protein
MRTKTKIDPQKIYVAWQGFSTTLPDGTPFAAQTGTRLRGSHPAVRHVGEQAFVEDGTLSDEIPTAVGVVAAMNITPDPAPVGVVLEQLSGPGVVESTEDWQFGHELVSKGQRLRDSHPLVRQYPDCFRPV